MRKAGDEGRDDARRDEARRGGGWRRRARGCGGVVSMDVTIYRGECYNGWRSGETVTSADSRRVVRETGARLGDGRGTGWTNSEHVFRVFRDAIDDTVVLV